jgi:hypothetical protein
MTATMQGFTGVFKKYWMPLFVFVSLLYVAYYISSQLDRFGNDISLSLMPLAGSALFQFLFWIVSSYLWSMALITVSSKKVSLVDSFFQLCLVNLGKYIPGKIWGMFARGSYLKQRHDIDVGRIIQATYIEQMYLLGSGVILASLIVAAISSRPILWAVAPVISLVIIIASVYQKPLTSMIRFAHRLGRSDATYELQNFDLPAIRQLAMLVMYVVVWLLLSMVMYGLYLALFQAEISWHMAAVMTLSCIAGMSAGFVAIFSPGGVGVREAVSGGILAAYMPMSDAILLVLLFRIWLAVLEVIVGGTLYLRNRKQVS